VPTLHLRAAKSNVLDLALEGHPPKELLKQKMLLTAFASSAVHRGKLRRQTTVIASDVHQIREFSWDALEATRNTSQHRDVDISALFAQKPLRKIVEHTLSRLAYQKKTIGISAVVRASNPVTNLNALLPITREDDDDLHATGAHKVVRVGDRGLLLAGLVYDQWIWKSSLSSRLPTAAVTDGDVMRAVVLLRHCLVAHLKSVRRERFPLR
jgi:hypothetical protein